MGRGKPRHKDRDPNAPPPGTVPDDYPCACQCHDGVPVLCFKGCCAEDRKLRVSAWRARHPDGA